MIGYGDSGIGRGDEHLYVVRGSILMTHVYLAYSNPATPSCGPRVTFDGLKVFQAMATAAWLSGKPMTVYSVAAPAASTGASSTCSLAANTNTRAW